MKHIYLSACLLTFAASASAQLSDGLVAHYKCDGSAVDSSPNANHGTIYGAVPATDNLGNPAAALSFDGVDDHITIPYSADLKPDFPFTVSCWVKMEETGYNMIFKSDLDLQDYYGFWLSIGQNHTLDAHFGDGGSIGSGSRRTKTSASTITIGDWHLVTAVFNNDTDIDLYIDCTDGGGSFSGSANTMVYSNASSEIYYDENTQGSVYTNGDLNELMIWDRALTTEELESLCTSFLSVEQPKLASDLVTYPNPTTGKVKLSGYEGEIQTATILDALGKTVIVLPISQEEIDLGNLPQGVYLLEALSSEGIRYCERIVLEK